MIVVVASVGAEIGVEVRSPRVEERQITLLAGVVPVALQALIRKVEEGALSRFAFGRRIRGIVAKTTILNAAQEENEALIAFEDDIASFVRFINLAVAVPVDPFQLDARIPAFEELDRILIELFGRIVFAGFAELDSTRNIGDGESLLELGDCGAELIDIRQATRSLGALMRSKSTTGCRAQHVRHGYR